MARMARRLVPSAVLPLAIAGTSLTIRDSQGITRPAELYFVSSSQVNYVIPPGTATGNALVTVIHPAENSDGCTYTTIGSFRPAAADCGS